MHLSMIFYQSLWHIRYIFSYGDDSLVQPAPSNSLQKVWTHVISAYSSEWVSLIHRFRIQKHCIDILKDKLEFITYFNTEQKKKKKGNSFLDFVFLWLYPHSFPKLHLFLFNSQTWDWSEIPKMEAPEAPLCLSNSSKLTESSLLTEIITEVSVRHY